MHMTTPVCPPPSSPEPAETIAAMTAITRWLQGEVPPGQHQALCQAIRAGIGIRLSDGKIREIIAQAAAGRRRQRPAGPNTALTSRRPG